METIMWLGFVLVALPATGKVFIGKAGMKVSLSCGIYKSNAEQAWYHGNPRQRIIHISGAGFMRKGSADVQKRSRVMHDGSLSIFPVLREDAGEFTCEAERKSETHTLLVVSVGSPGRFLAGSTARLQCEVDGLEKSPGMQWMSPKGMKYSSPHELSPVSLSDSGDWTCTFSYGGEPHSEQLVVKVEEPPPATPPTTTQGPKNHKPPCSNCGPVPGSGNIQLSWWMWTAIGGGCLFVLLLLVLVIILCKRIRRKKRMRNRQPWTPRQYCQCNQPTAARKPQQGRKKRKPSALPLQPQLKE